MKAKRKGLSKKVRFEVFKRDSFTCSYCGNKPPKVVLEVDHIVPVCDGGANDDVNLTTSCFDCNRGKGKHGLDSKPKLIDENLKDDLEKKKELAEQVAELNRFFLEKKEIDDSLINDMGVYWENNYQKEKDKYTFSSQRIANVRGFLKKLSIEEVYDAMEITFAKGVSYHQSWRYFCGVCWNKIREDK